MVSNFYNEIEDFQRNDIILPIFDPKLGSTDFLDDQHLTFFHQYVKMLLSMEYAVGKDIRMRMEGLSYDAFCQRVNKSLKMESKLFSDTDNF